MGFDFKMLSVRNSYCAKWKDFCPAQYIHTPVHITSRTPQEQFPLHNHDFDELIYVYKGFGVNFFRNQFKLILPGHVFFYQAQHYHAYPLSCDLHLLNMLINKENLSDDYPYFQKLSSQLNLYQKHYFPIPLSYHDFLQLRSLSEKIKSEAIEDDEYSHLMIASIFKELIIIVLRSLEGRRQNIAASNRSGYGFFKLLQKDTLTNIYNHEDFHQILTHHQVHERKFKSYLLKMTGLTPNHLIQYNRMLHFANLFLEDTSYNIEELCYEAGYKDYRSFSRNVSIIFGQSPRRVCHHLTHLKNTLSLIK
ncbi:MAG: AraC family transcriptional regulator [Alphaproteobacteria bacterium]